MSLTESRVNVQFGIRTNLSARQSKLPGWNSNQHSPRIKARLNDNGSRTNCHVIGNCDIANRLSSNPKLDIVTYHRAVTACAIIPYTIVTMKRTVLTNYCISIHYYPAAMPNNKTTIERARFHKEPETSAEFVLSSSRDQA